MQKKGPMLTELFNHANAFLAAKPGSPRTVDDSHLQ